MFTRGIYHSQLLNDCTLINMHPGTVNTRIQIAGWGTCGIDIVNAKDTYKLAVKNKFLNPGGFPKYYKSMEETNPTAQARDKEACLKIYSHLSSMMD